MEYTRICFSNEWLSIQDLPNEIWKDVFDYEGLYQVSNYGRVKSLRREIHRCNYITIQEPKIMRQNITGPDGKNYLAVDLHKDGKRKKIKVHRLVAEYFIGNPNNLPCINHKNEDKFDNCVDNLEWCSYSYNNTYNNLKQRQHKNKLNPPSISYAVIQVDSNGNFIAEYPSMSEASRRTNIPLGTIRGYCARNVNRKKYGNTLHGFRWFCKEGVRLRNNRKKKLIL